MIAFIEFEVRDYQNRHILKHVCYDSTRDFDGNLISEKRYNFLPWVAEISDFDLNYIFKRDFIPSTISYSRANSKLSRGVYLQWWLESGKLYQVYEGWNNKRKKYNCRVDGEGLIIKITEDDVANSLVAAGKDPFCGKALS